MQQTPIRCAPVIIRFINGGCNEVGCRLTRLVDQIEATHDHLPPGHRDRWAGGQASGAGGSSQGSTKGSSRGPDSGPMCAGDRGVNCGCLGPGCLCRLAQHPGYACRVCACPIRGGGIGDRGCLSRRTGRPTGCLRGAGWGTGRVPRFRAAVSAAASRNRATNSTRSNEAGRAAVRGRLIHPESGERRRRPRASASLRASAYSSRAALW